MNYAICLSGGVGSRMQSKIPKQYLDVEGYPILYYSLKAFEDAKSIDRVIIVAADEYIEYVKKEIVERYGLLKVTDIIAGGKERYDSVYEGLKHIYINEENPDNSLCLIHDGARPCILTTQIEEIVRETDQKQAVVAAAPVKDTIRTVGKDMQSLKTLDRSILWQMQTPQSFNLKLVYDAFSKMYNNNDFAGVTDDVMVVEKFMGVHSHMYMAGYNNIKVTTPEDLLYVKAVLSSREKTFL